MERKIKNIYQDHKDMVNDCMRNQPTVEYGKNFLFYSLENYSDEPVTEPEWLCFFVALALYELTHGGITSKVEETMTYWIYQYEHFGLYQNEFEDKELLDKDIAEIKSLMHLRFEDLKCYEG